MNNKFLKTGTQIENLIIADAEYIDKVTFDLIVNFERMIGRRIPPADIAHWIDCIALDGGLREGEHETQVVLIHNKGNNKLENFRPAEYDDELNSKAFKDNLGEFVITSFPVEELISKEDFFIEIVKTVCNQEKVKRIMIIPDADNTYDKVRRVLYNVNDEKRITVFAMQPMQGGNFRQEILGYSLMSALGINADEIR